MSTNIYILCTILLVTNRFSHPSGKSDFVTNVVECRVMAPVMVNGGVYLLSTNIPVSSNVLVLVDVALASTNEHKKLTRRPLEIKDEIPANLFPPEAVQDKTVSR